MVEPYETAGAAAAAITDKEYQDYPDQLITEYTLRTLDDTDEIWYYDPMTGCYKPNAEPIIKARIERDKGMPHIDPKTGQMKESDLTTYDVNEYLDHIRRRKYISREDFNPSIEWIACNNCMINLKTGKTCPFSPDFMNTNHIPVNYRSFYNLRPNGTGAVADFFRLVERPCPAIMKFLHDIMAPDDVNLILDFMAYCLWRDYKFNFWLLLNGAGLNGKSILLALFERFLGKDNVSGETLDRLLKGTFTTASLFQKMINVDADVSPNVIFDNTGIIKKLTGNDLTAAEYKYKKPFAFRNYAKLWFSCNKIPETEDETDAFFRRIIIINFTQQFFGEKEDPNLIDKLCTDEEFSGLLYELLCRLPDVLEKGIRKVTNEGMAETYEKYTMGSNPVKYFVEKGLEIDAGSKIIKLKLYEHYERFCREFGLAPESQESFSRKLKEGFGFEVKRFRLKGELPYCWVGIRLKDWQKDKQKEEDNLEEFSFSDETKEQMK